MKWKIFLIILIVVLGGLWRVRALTAPQPGRTIEDQGREHVTPAEVSEFAYKSNPPTSGPHLPTWVKSGIYTEPQSKGELIHSLEHGYIEIHYNCNVHPNAFFFQKVFAHEEDGSPSSTLVDPTIATGSAINTTESCKTLQKQLEDFAKQKKLWKLIVVPNPTIDTTIALAAWGHLDAFDTFDAKRIEAFIDYYRDHGPEKTME